MPEEPGGLTDKCSIFVNSNFIVSGVDFGLFSSPVLTVFHYAVYYRGHSQFLARLEPATFLPSLTALATVTPPTSIYNPQQLQPASCYW